MIGHMEAAAMEAAVMAVAAMAVVPPAVLTDPSVHNSNDCGIGDLLSGAVWLFLEAEDLAGQCVGKSRGAGRIEWQRREHHCGDGGNQRNGDNGHETCVRRCTAKRASGAVAPKP
jgi:hypothetical protein